MRIEGGQVKPLLHLGGIPTGYIEIDHTHCLITSSQFLRGCKADTCWKEENLSFNMMYNMFELNQVL